MAFTDLAVLVDFEQSFCADLIDTWRFENETGENIYIYTPPFLGRRDQLEYQIHLDLFIEDGVFYA